MNTTWGAVYAAAPPGVVKQRIVIERRVLGFKVSVVVVVLAIAQVSLAAPTHPEIAGYLAEASWPISLRPITFGPLALRRELAILLGVAEG